MVSKLYVVPPIILACLHSWTLVNSQIHDHQFDLQTQQMLTCALPNFDSDDLVSFRTPAKSWTLFPVCVIAALLLLCSLGLKLQTLVRMNLISSLKNLQIVHIKLKKLRKNNIRIVRHYILFGFLLKLCTFGELECTFLQAIIAKNIWSTFVWTLFLHA